MNTKSERIAKPPTALTTVVTWAAGTLAGFSLFTSNSQVLEWASFNEAPQPQQKPCLVRLRGKFVGVAKTVGCWIWYAAGVGGAARAGGVLVLLLADGAGVLFGAELGLGGGMLTTRYGGCAGRSASGMYGCSCQPRPEGPGWQIIDTGCGLDGRPRGRTQVSSRGVRFDTDPEKPRKVF